MEAFFGQRRSLLIFCKRHIGPAIIALVGLAALAIPRPALATDAKTLASQVQIRRTQYGVPHITADNLEAAAFGLGYCQAEDHLQDILRGILGVRGEMAANFGSNKNVEDDFSNRHYRVYQRAVEGYHKLDADYRAMVEGFAAGLN